jgi:predicted transcriptional regulator
MAASKQRKYPAPKSVRLDNDLDARLETMMVAEERSASWIIKKALEEYVSKWEARNKQR